MIYYFKNIAGLALLVLAVQRWKNLAYYNELWGLFWILFFIGLYRGLIVGFDDEGISKGKYRAIFPRTVPVITTIYLVPVLMTYLAQGRNLNYDQIHLTFLALTIALILKLSAHLAGTGIGLIIYINTEDKLN